MKLHRFLAALLAAALLGSAPAMAADESPAPDDLFTLGPASEYGELSIEESGGELMAEPNTYTAREEASMAAAGDDAGLPSRYDPRGEAFLTPVRSQGSWNTCWLTSAMAAAELNGLKRGLLAGPASAVDLSERHLLYFFTHRAEDPLGNSSADYNINPTFWLENGGNPVAASMTMAGWHGPAGETATSTPYGGLSDGDTVDARYAYTDLLHLENTYAFDAADAAGRQTLKTMLLSHGAAVLCLYYSSEYAFFGSPSALTQTASEPIYFAVEADSDPDAAEETGSAESTEELSDDAEPEQTEELPEQTPAEASDGPDTETNADFSEEQTADIPEALPDMSPDEISDGEDPPDEAADGAPSAEADSYTELDDAPADVPLLDGATEEALPVDGTNAEDYTVCYYQNAHTNTNHEVVVVGWDDDYPAANFGLSPKGATPPADGAWLCRNTQNPEGMGDGGYFWVSYYDASVAASTGNSISGRVTVFDFGPADDFDNNYEYDGAAVLGYMNDALEDGRGVSTLSADSSTRRWYANVFTAKAGDSVRCTELLRAVSTYTYRAGVSYTVRVYTDLTDASDPASGVLAAETAGSFPQAGYHTVRLPEAVELREGESFSVVFCVGMASDSSVFVPSCYTSSGWYCTNETLTGQSFVALDGSTWHDCRSLKNQPNVRIKAFTDTVAPVFPFTDVSENAWYGADVLSAWLSGLVDGMTATSYQPAGMTSRAQVVTVLWRLAGRPAPKGSAAFSDVRSDAWYSLAVAWAAENGIVNGYENGLFRPNSAITRQELMTVLYRFAQQQGVDVSRRADLTAFTDGGSVADWASEAASWSVAAGLQQGVALSDGTVKLSPAGAVTRAQLAAFMNRAAALCG